MRRLSSPAKKTALLCLAASLSATCPVARGEYLFQGFIDPHFSPAFSTEYSAWDVFYTPYAQPNYPDYAAPNGIYQSRPANFPANAAYFPANPYAYWDVNNPTITQTGTSTSFIISAGVAGGGNIYSFAAAESFVLNDTTPYALGTAVFQFQTAGTLLDFSSIVLRYTDGNGVQHDLSPNEMIREYEGSGSSFGGLANRAALQWNLNGLNISNYQILFHSNGSSTSFQMATLDTSNTFAQVVPASGAWTATGTGALWSGASNWQNSSLPQENANARFINTAATNMTLDASHTIGELRFETANNVTLLGSAGATLTSNTGITTSTASTGVYTITSNYALGALNLFDIEAGEVHMNGMISGNYSMEKDGNGTLVLAGNNTFTGSVSVNGGVLRLEGTNNYSGSTAALFGNLVVANEAPSGSAGALGIGGTPIVLGADSATFANIGDTSAQLTIDGNHIVGRDISLANGIFQKTLAAQNAVTGATFSGTVDFSTATAIRLHTTASTDRLNFTGSMINGSGGTVTADGPGTIIFSGANKAYASATNITGGTLQISSGTSFTGNGDVTVGNGTKLLVHGTLSGTGNLAINGGTVGGSGTINRTFALDTGDVLAPGNGVGTLNTVSESWAGGGALKLELNAASGVRGTNWDNVNITGALSLSASSGSKFTLQLQSLTASGVAGALTDFNPASNYTWTFLTASGGITGFNASAFQIDTSGFANSFGGTFSVGLSSDSKSLNLVYLAVPEPSSALLLLGGGALFFRRRRRPAHNLR